MVHSSATSEFNIAEAVDRRVERGLTTVDGVVLGDHGGPLMRAPGARSARA